MNQVDQLERAIGILSSSDQGGLRAALESKAGCSKLVDALLPDFSETEAHDIAFHMADGDAMCVLALFARPNSFSPPEARAVLQRFLIHAPNHIAAAAKLGGSIVDAFAVGALEGRPPEPPEVAV